MKRLTFILALTISLPVGASMLPGSAANGGKLFQQHCQKCHTDAKSFSAAARRVKSIEGLVGRVNACNRQLGTPLSDSGIDDVVRYLNERFYRFGQ
jgi:mono/diheme cytochrome c family protein